MKKQIYLCVDLTARTQEHGLSVGVGRKGMLMMTEDGEKFEFDEALPQVCERNPKLWSGKLLNVHKNKKGELVVNFKRTVLDAKLDPCTFADELFLDVERAKVELGI